LADTSKNDLQWTNAATVFGTQIHQELRISEQRRVQKLRAFTFRKVVYAADTIILASTAQDLEAIYRIDEIYLVDERDVWIKVMACENLGRDAILHYKKVKCTTSGRQCYRSFEHVQAKLCTVPINMEPDSHLIESAVFQKNLVKTKPCSENSRYFTRFSCCA
jgi:hypothetical protein